MNIKTDDVELLAPVGNLESLYAAIENGANAIYLGGKFFSARQYASNFDLNELKKIVEYAHLRDVKVYVTVNTLVDDEEMEEILDYIKYLYEIDVDGLIVQDIGLSFGIKKMFPKFELHGSTQMTINNLAGALFLEKLGFKRVVLARELSIKEIKYIKENSNIELEGFIHGALCVCYSGQCLMSSIIGGRSGNRGRCAQPCRMPYTIVDYEEGDILFEEFDKRYLLSPKDLNTIKSLDKIIKSGISTLKIEGRMKRPEYVAVVVNKYRKALDEGVDKITDEDEREILEIFNRGFTKGFTFNDYGRDFISFYRPDNRGVYVGEVKNIDNRYMYLYLTENINVDDGIEFEKKNGEYVGTIIDTSLKKGNDVKFPKIKGVSKNSKIFKTSNAKLLEKAKASYEIKNKTCSIDMKVFISLNKPAELIIIDKNFTVKVKSSMKVEKAINVELTKEKVKKQLGKLSDTPYYIKNISINLDEGCFLPISEINGLRRKGIAKLNEKRANFNNRKPVEDNKYIEKKKQIFKFSKKRNFDNRRISVKISKMNQFNQLNLNKLDRIYIEYFEGVKACIEEAKKYNKEVYFWTDKILNDEDLIQLEKNVKPLESILDGISVSNLGTFNFVKNRFNLPIHGDIGLNIFNSLSANYFNKKGVNSVTLSPELNLGQIKRICKNDLGTIETVGYGYLPLMVMKHCPISLVKNCKNNDGCRNCFYKEGYALKDRMGKFFYMERKNKNTILYNSVPLMILEELEDIFDKGVDMIRLDFTFEKNNVNLIQETFYDFAKGNINRDKALYIANSIRKDSDVTKGHYYRGVL